ncbi:MAG: hypothetical protein JSW49_04540 [candidate division WOR-3 bacterium]|nr:MAG: hypothetical protein JSW49_04540 [candidate division WOR-3 bacterium]
MNDRIRLKQIAKEDTRYHIEAYVFVLEALNYTRQSFNIEGHVTGRQLLEGIRNLGLERYGAMCKMVFEHWGITKTIDFGNIVITMVNTGLLSKTPEDSIDDFVDVYDFDDAFVKGYRVDITKKKNEPRRKK